MAFWAAAAIALPVLCCAASVYAGHPLSVAAFAAFFGFVYAVRRYRLEKRVFLAAFPLMVVLQCVAGWSLAVDGALWDMKDVVDGARALASGGPVSGYFYRYPNNLPVLFLFAGVFRLSDLLFGSTSPFFLTGLNILLVDASVVLMMLLVGRLKSERAGWLAGAVMLFFAPFYLFIPLLYTDALALFFVALGLYFAVRLEDLWRDPEAHPAKRCAASLFEGLVCACGFLAKGVPAVVMVGVCVQMSCRLPLRKCAAAALLVLAGFLAGVGGWKAAVASSGLVSPERLEAESFPLAHWVMIGLSERGSFNHEDVSYTDSFPSYAEKKAAAGKEIVRRLRGMGLPGLVRHISAKVHDTWTSPTCSAEVYLQHDGKMDVERKGVRSILFDDADGRAPGPWRRRVFRACCNGVFLFLVLFSALHYLIAARDPEACAVTLSVALAFVGEVLFFAVWECHPRYTFHIMPVFVAMATLSFANVFKEPVDEKTA